MAWAPADALHAEVVRRSRIARALTIQQWSQINPDGDWAAEWQARLSRVLLIVASAQVAAAKAADTAAVAALWSLGWDGQTTNGLVPLSLAGWMEPDDSPYQVPLASALGVAPVVAARSAVGTLEQRLAAGANLLDSLTQAAVSHSGRMAVQVGAHGRTRNKLTFYEPGKACQRCAVLVGKSAGMHVDFKRHPRCDGVVVEIPSGKANPIEPLDLDNITDLTAAQQQAIADGADVNQVINAKSAVSSGRVRGSVLSDDGNHTRYGRRASRLTPKGIYNLAGGDREKALALLRANGYLR